MTQKRANELMIERFEALCEVAEESESLENAEHLIALTDSAHKLFITLTNARAFEGAETSLEGGGFKN